jgi:hypothetical protein
MDLFPIVQLFRYISGRLSDKRLKLNRADTVFPEEKDCILVPVFSLASGPIVGVANH